MSVEEKNEAAVLELHEVKKKKTKPRNKKKKSGGYVKYIVAIVVMISSCILISRNVVSAGANAVSDGYDTAFNRERDSVWQEWYQKYFDKAEQEYHVSNRAAITIGELKKTAKLEVLQVSDVEYVIDKNEDNKNNITAWLEVPGTANYTVDLQAAEFVTDDEHAFVLVRVPYPELSNITIDYENVQKLLFKNDLLNDSYRVGEDLARKQLSQADILIRKEFASNQNYYQSAQDAAKTSITSLIRQLNPDIDDLTVEVEFYGSL